MQHTPKNSMTMNTCYVYAACDSALIYKAFDSSTKLLLKLSDEQTILQWSG